MIHFPATLEIVFCLIVGLFTGFIVGWLFGSPLVAVAVGVAVMCWALDGLFSFDVDEDDEY